MWGQLCDTEVENTMFVHIKLLSNAGFKAAEIMLPEWEDVRLEQTWRRLDRKVGMAYWNWKSTGGFHWLSKATKTTVQ